MKSRIATSLGLAGALMVGTVSLAIAQTSSEGTAADQPAATERQGHGKRMGKFHGKRFGKRGHGRHAMGAALDLTDEQKAQIRAIRQASREQTAALRTQMRELRTAMHEASKAGAFDEAQFRSLAEQRAAISVDLAVERAKVQSAIHNTVLTAEQRTKLAEFAAKRTEKRAEWKQRRQERKQNRQE